ncbi:MAG: NAD(P)/FAD-dependent oxidoreductase [Candidatus Korarchaeum sp.]|nr:NAD(P)/FAD-dependent oxidoreductase [Candidatus Korarchaeum sp.]
MRADVLIVGGGIAGSTLASLLSNSGFDVVIVERKRRAGYPHHCSGILGFDAIKELLLFSEDWVLSEVNWSKFISPGGVELEVSKPLAKVVNRSEMDKETWELALSYGAKGMLSTPFKRLISRNEALIKGDIVSFDLIVGADGPLSSVAQAHGLPSMEAELGLQRECELKVGDGYVVKLLGGSKFSWTQPWRDHAKVGVIGEVRDPLRELIMRSCHPALGRFEGKLIPKRIRRRFQGRGFALVGDAAGQIKPLSRGGVLFAVRAAKLLAEELKRGWDLLDKPLRIYERNWWKINWCEVALGRALRSYLEGLSPKDLDSIFRDLKDHEDALRRFETDRQTSPIRAVPKAKVLKLSLSRPRASFSAAMELVRYLMRW